MPLPAWPIFSEMVVWKQRRVYQHWAETEGSQPAIHPISPLHKKSILQHLQGDGFYVVCIYSTDQPQQNEKKKKNPLVMLGKRSSLETACGTGHQCPYICVQQKKIQACQQPWSNKVRCSHWSQRGRVRKTYFEVQTCHFFAMCHYVTPPQQDLVLPINDVIFRGSRCFQIS